MQKNVNPSVKKLAKAKRKKYLLVEIAWDQKDIRSAAGAANISVAKFCQVQVKNAVERFKSRQLRLL